MFITNKYSRWYYSIIQNAINRNVINGYVEKHHIIPKSLGGSNKFQNIVTVTAREHYILHLLLTKMTKKKHRSKMIHAAWNMCQQTKPGRNYKVSARLYESLRVEHSKITSSLQKGKSKSPQTIEKMRLAALNRNPAHNLKISLGQIGRKVSEETRKKISIKAKLRESNPDQKKKNSDRQKGYRWWTNGKTNKRSKTHPGEGWMIGRS